MPVVCAWQVVSISISCLLGGSDHGVSLYSHVLFQRWLMRKVHQPLHRRPATRFQSPVNGASMRLWVQAADPWPWQAGKSSIDGVSSWENHLRIGISIAHGHDYQRDPEGTPTQSEFKTFQDFTGLHRISQDPKMGLHLVTLEGSPSLYRGARRIWRRRCDPHRQIKERFGLPFSACTQLKSHAEDGAKSAIFKGKSPN
eukprot:s118_g34.t1